MAVALLFGTTAHAAEVGVAARVNGVEISVFRLERHFEDYLKDKGRNVGAIRNPKVYKRLKREALDQLIDKELLWQEARKRDIRIDDQAVAQARDKVAAGYKSRQAFLRRLDEAGFSEADFADYLRRDLAAQAALGELTRSAEPGDEEVRRAYAASRERFDRPEQVRARHILIKVAPGAGAEEKAAARRRLEELKAELDGGADFAELARKHSQDASSRQGGDLGYFGRGRMVPSFEQTAFGLAPGQVGGPVETVFGWHLIRVDQRLPAQGLPEDQALSLVRRQLAAERRIEAGREALKALREAARVEVFLAL